MRIRDTGAITPPMPFGYTFLSEPQPLLENQWVVLAVCRATSTVGVLVYNYQQALHFFEAGIAILFGRYLLNNTPGLTRFAGEVFAREFAEEIEAMQRAWELNEMEQIRSLVTLLGRPAFAEREEVQHG